MIHALEDLGILVLPPVMLNSVHEALELIGSCDYFLGTRMHSCIFAAIQDVPFACVAYEHKHMLLNSFNCPIIYISEISGDPPSPPPSPHRNVSLNYRSLHFGH